MNKCDKENFKDLASYTDVNPKCMFTLFVKGGKANRTDSTSNGIFTNIRCSCFDTILRFIRFSVTFWQPSSRIEAQDLTFHLIDENI
jgi:hypothetical protein